MGVVYRAHQILMDRVVALKLLPPELTKNQKFVEEFLAEARSAGRLNHPNLIRVHEVGKSGDVYYYSMEYIEGFTLGELMDECENGVLDPKRAVGIILQVAAALDHGLRASIIHREIRPDSIMITDGDVAKLSDLGLVKDEETRFLEGENAHYVAPEQAKGGVVDTRTDIYCLGCCLFHAITGEPPFEGAGPKEVLGRRLLSDPPDPQKINPELPEDIALLCRKMMARDPGDRYQTPAELSLAIRELSYFMPTTGSEVIQAAQGQKRHSRPTLRMRNRGKFRTGARRRRYRR
jgi:serine/threonine-protein kinase